MLVSTLICCVIFANLAAANPLISNDEQEERLKHELLTNTIITSSEEVNLYSGQQYTPIVYWHGMGDFAWNVKRAFSFIEKELPGVYVKSIQIGDSVEDDIKNGYFKNVNDQIEMVCKMLAEDQNLQHGYNGIGISQGSQFLRGVIQRCPNPPMRNFISLGGQHQGIFGLPKCSAPKKQWCEFIDKMLSFAAYSAWVQNFLVQAEYWHDPFKTTEYISKSVFLADINNERIVNETYKQNLQNLDNMVLVMFENDTIVEPKESSWFGYFKDGNDKIIQPLEDSALFQEDRLGLKVMKANGKLHFLSTEGDHIQFKKQWFIKNILKPYLDNRVSK